MIFFWIFIKNSRGGVEFPHFWRIGCINLFIISALIPSSNSENFFPRPVLLISFEKWIRKSDYNGTLLLLLMKTLFCRWKMVSAVVKIGSLKQGCQIFLGTTYQKRVKIYPNDLKIDVHTNRHQIYQTAWILHKICNHFQFKGPLKYTQIGSFGIQI
jgi:hypothetical protein